MTARCEASKQTVTGIFLTKPVFLSDPAKPLTIVDI